MPCTDIVSYQYLIPVTVLWTLLFGATLFHGIRNRESRHGSRGWQLYASIVIILGVLAIESLLQLILATAYHGDVTVVQNVLGYTRLFFCSLSDSLFIALLLAIAGGFCITREALGPYKDKVIGIPTVYLISDLVLQFVMVSTYSNEALLSSVERFVLALLLLANLMALLLAWIYTFDLLSREIDELELQSGNNRAVQMAEMGLQGTEGRTDVEADAMAAGYATAPDPNNPAYANISAHDEDVETSFADKLALRDKILLMRRFRWAVVVYIIATAAVELLPIFLFAPAVNPEGDPVSATEGYLHVLTTIIIVGHTAVLLLFVGGLAFIFRLRPHNPYLMLDEEGPDMATGLGVFDDSPSNTPPRASSPAADTNARISASHQSEQPLDALGPPPGDVAKVATKVPAVNGGDGFVSTSPELGMQDSAMSVDRVAMASAFSLADDEDYAELGISRDPQPPAARAARARQTSKDAKEE